MGVDSTDAYGKPVFNDAFALPGDLAAAVAYADTFANGRRGTSSERQGLVAGKRRDGMLFVETDTGDVYLWRDSTGWGLWSKGWTAYTPTITGFTLVGGAFDIAKFKVERGVATVKFRARVASMSGNPTIGLPTSAPASDALLEHLVSQVALIPGAGSESIGIVRKSATNQVIVYSQIVSGSNVYLNNISSTVPIAWGSTGTMAGWFQYETA